LTSLTILAVTKKSSVSLLLTSFNVLKWPIIQAVPPRAALTALLFCQPFLINHAITLSQEAITPRTTQTGYGLIGAYFLVYVGMAVCLSASPSSSDHGTDQEQSYAWANTSTAHTAPSPWLGQGWYRFSTARRAA
jgi:hypothetical protein